MMTEDDKSIVALTRTLETLIAKTVSIESLDNKLTDLVQKFNGMADTLDETHKLVNSRMTALLDALEKAAALASKLAGEEGEERGAVNERARAKREEAPPSVEKSG